MSTMMEEVEERLGLDDDKTNPMEALHNVSSVHKFLARFQNRRRHSHGFKKWSLLLLPLLP